jgi:acetyl-CoA synthetase
MQDPARDTSYQRFVQARDFLLQHRSDYATAYRDFEWPQFDTFNWALDYFDVIARGNAEPALWIVEEDGSEAKLSYAELSARSNQVANWLRSVGVQRGDCLMLMLGNDVALWETVLAAIKLGAVVCPASTLLVEADIEDRVERGRVRHVVVGAAFTDRYANVDAQCTRIVVGAASGAWRSFDESHACSRVFEADGATDPKAPLLYYFTSGTTSKPKLVVHSHQSYPVGHLSTMYWIGLQPGDVHLNISSPGWAKHAWSCIFAPWNAQACVFIYNSNRFSANNLLETLQTYRVTTLCAPPTVWRLLIQANLGDYRMQLREIVGAGEPLNPEVLQQVRAAWGITIRDGFGQTETTCQIGNTPGQPVKDGSMGRPLPGYRVTLIDANDDEAGEGEICLPLSTRPAGLMLGYFQAEQQTAKVMHNGVYHTGDVAQIDGDGYITHVGRADDVFKSADYRISPFELESVLIEHASIVEAAIVPSPDPVRLNVPKAFVILTAGSTPSAELAREILAFCRERLAPYKRIRRIEFGDLPKTISGKIRRSDLRKQEEATRQAGTRAEWEFFEDDF